MFMAPCLVEQGQYIAVRGVHGKLRVRKLQHNIIGLGDERHAHDTGQQHVAPSNKKQASNFTFTHEYTPNYVLIIRRPIHISVSRLHLHTTA